MENSVSLVSGILRTETIGSPANSFRHRPAFSAVSDQEIAVFLWFGVIVILVLPCGVLFIPNPGVVLDCFIVRHIALGPL